MPLFGSRSPGWSGRLLSGARRLVVALAVSLAAGQPGPIAVAARPIEPQPPEIRALWVLRTSMTSPDAIASLVRVARASGFNTLLVQVRGRGDAYFNGGLEPRAADLLRQPASFDPLATVIAAAHGAGLRVHAWVNLSLISSAVDLPVASAHIVHRHPEWLMVPRDLARELARVDANSPAYLARIARWTRSQVSGPARMSAFEGLYMSPVQTAAIDHINRVVGDLTTRYEIDGVHLDYARFPSARYDYSRYAVRAFRAAVRPGLDAAQRRVLDRREATDPLAYPDALPEAWTEFRVARMTELMTRLRATIKAARPAALVSVATVPDLIEARSQRLQDWGAWLAAGLVDAVCPMAYTPEPARFAEQIAAVRRVAGERAVWAGIGAYRLAPGQTIRNIQTARRLGAAGVVLFSYDSLIDPKASAPGYLASVGRTAFLPGADSPAGR